jgi:hypothetical protein
LRYIHANLIHQPKPEDSGMIVRVSNNPFYFINIDFY